LGRTHRLAGELRKLVEDLGQHHLDLRNIRLNSIFLAATPAFARTTS
jgi:hypothetical protein